MMNEVLKIIREKFVSLISIHLHTLEENEKDIEAFYIKYNAFMNGLSDHEKSLFAYIMMASYFKGYEDCINQISSYIDIDISKVN